MSQATQRGAGPIHRLCQPDHWELHEVLGLHPGYLITLHCADGHLHHATRHTSYPAARTAIRRWVRDVFGERHPGLLIEDHPRGRLILPDGRQWPLTPPASTSGV